jgi:hypothetical protein
MREGGSIYLVDGLLFHKHDRCGYQGMFGERETEYELSRSWF